MKRFLVSVLSGIILFHSSLKTVSAEETRNRANRYLVALSPSAERKISPIRNVSALERQLMEIRFFSQYGMHPIASVSLPGVYHVQVTNRALFNRYLSTPSPTFRYIESDLDSTFRIPAAKATAALPATRLTTLSKQASQKQQNQKQQSQQQQQAQSTAGITANSEITPQTAEDPEDNNWSLDPYWGANVRDTWPLTTGDSSVVVAVLGTGIDLTHSDLSANLWKDPLNTFSNIKESKDGFNVFNTTVRNPPQDSHGITTHAAGVIGAKGNNNIGVAGVAWNVKMMPVRVVSSSGNSLSTSVPQVVEGLNYIIKKKNEGAKVVAVYNFINFASDSNNTLRDKITELGNAGILFITAAGDQTKNLNTAVSVPGSFTNPNLISVGSYYGYYAPTTPPHFSMVDYSSFSNFGNARVHLAAPGEIIRSTWINNSYMTFAGTVDSAAYVAGVAALVKSRAPSYTGAQIKDQILNHVRTYPAVLASRVITQGVLDAYLAVSTLPSAKPGDYDGDGDVDGADFLAWQRGYGGTGANLPADGNRDGVVDAADYTIWRDNYGS